MIKRLISSFLCVAFLAGCATVDYRAHTSVVRLPTDRASYFYSNHLTGSGYIELKSDGAYRQIAREHMGVWPFDGGTWSQDADGILTLISTGMCADIISPPLEISVGRPEYAERLPALRQEIQEFLKSRQDTQFVVTNEIDDILIKVEGDYPLYVELNYLTDRRHVYRHELKALVSQLDAYLTDPAERNCKAVPLRYKDRTFLQWLNCSTPCSRSLSEICSDIDETKPEDEVIYYDFLIPEEQFEKEVKKPYPFMFYPEMNKITGAE